VTGRPGHGDCTFCAIADGTSPARVITRTDEVLAFLPDVPAVYGHTLLIPRRHVRDIWEINQASALALAEALPGLARTITKAVGTKDMNIIQSNGASAGQTVFHLHVHLVPRAVGDRMPHLWPPDTRWSGADLDKMAAAIKKQLPS
jgi:histidine triad (HIT) family protein